MHVRVQSSVEQDQDLPAPLLIASLARPVLEHTQDGRFQRSLALITAGSSFVSGLEVAYEHYKGSYSNLIMYTPVVLSGVVSLSSFGGVFSERIARGPMRWACMITLVDGVIGFGFLFRGIMRKSGV